jgi:hypothetical protein
MKKLFAVLVALLLLGVMTSCGGGGGSSSSGGTEEGLTKEQAESLFKAPPSSLSNDEVILPNGQSLSDFCKENNIDIKGLTEKLQNNKVSIYKGGAIDPEQKKAEIITNMIIFAHKYSCGRDANPCDTWDYDVDYKDPLSVAQKGLTYI